MEGRNGGRGWWGYGLTRLPPYRSVTMRLDLSLTMSYLSGQIADPPPRLAIVLGSGLGRLAESIAGAKRIPYAEIPGFPATTVAGHRGELIFGMLDGTPVVVQNGRFHLYEGLAPGLVVFPIRLFAELGVRTLMATNAAGGLNPNFRPPCLMLISDHVNLMWRNPLIGNRLRGEHRFPDMLGLYDRGLRATASDIALEHGIPLAEGIYGAVVGPSFETPAEVSMLRRFGCDAVGMSTVPETIAASARGMRVLAISSITNSASGLSKGPLSHAEVLGAGRKTAGDLELVLRGVVGRLDAT